MHKLLAKKINRGTGACQRRSKRLQALQTRLHTLEIEAFAACAGFAAPEIEALQKRLHTLEIEAFAGLFAFAGFAGFANDLSLSQSGNANARDRSVCSMCRLCVCRAWQAFEAFAGFAKAFAGFAFAGFVVGADMLYCLLTCFTGC